MVGKLKWFLCEWYDTFPEECKPLIQTLIFMWMFIILGLFNNLICNFSLLIILSVYILLFREWLLYKNKV